MPKSESSGVQSVDRALSLLFAIAENPGTAFSLDSLSGIIGIDRSSVFRLLSTLMKRGLVSQDRDRKSYRLGYGIYGLASALHEQLGIAELSSPVLRRLARTTKENAHLAVLSGSRAVFIDRERAAKTIAANTNIGDSEDLHCTAVGKCLVCALDRDSLAHILGEGALARFTERSIVDPGKLAAELSLVRERGYATDFEENEENVTCVAAPILDFAGRVEAAIGISGPSGRMSERLEFYIAETRREGGELSGILRGRGAPTGTGG
jgi:DNA-binding IclR family transcriptional regulator